MLESTENVFEVKSIHSEKAEKLCEIQIIGGDFAKFCGLLRIYEL